MLEYAEPAAVLTAGGIPMGGGLMQIPFNRPHITGNEVRYIEQAVQNLHLSGNGPFTKKCESWLQSEIGCNRALLVHSGTAALELAAILLDIKPGDEIIMPSFTFVSTANAFILRGAVPVFVDIRPDVLNVDETLIEAAITERTKAIVPVHYAGVSCDMDAICNIAKKHGIAVVEDAAHGLLSKYKGRPIGSMGTLSAVSFHETKNIIAGEGGALLINDPSYQARAEIIVEKGTNRSQFFLGLADKYTWHDVGSSFYPSEIEAAFLWAQAEGAHAITQHRLSAWQNYHQLLEPLESAGYLRRPIIPTDCAHNAHLYYILLNDASTRTDLMKHLTQLGISAVFHYVPLHSSPAGQKFARCVGDLSHTDKLSSVLLRLPLWVGISDEECNYVVSSIRNFFAQRYVTSPVQNAIFSTF